MGGEWESGSGQGAVLVVVGLGVHTTTQGLSLPLLRA